MSGTYLEIYVVYVCVDFDSEVQAGPANREQIRSDSLLHVHLNPEANHLALG